MALQQKQPCVGGILHHVNAEQAYISIGVSGLSRRSDKALRDISFVALEQKVKIYFNIV